MCLVNRQSILKASELLLASPFSFSLFLKLLHTCPISLDIPERGRGEWHFGTSPSGRFRIQSGPSNLLDLWTRLLYPTQTPAPVFQRWNPVHHNNPDSNYYCCYCLEALDCGMHTFLWFKKPELYSRGRGWKYRSATRAAKLAVNEMILEFWSA